MFDYGEFPRLMNAARHGNTNTARTLLENGENPDGVSWTGDTPLAAAAKGGHVGTVRMFLNHGATIRPGLVHTVAGTPHLDVMRVLLQRGGDVNSRDILHQTPLHKAAAFGRASMTKLLIDHGARVNAKDMEGRTPLHVAVRYEFPETVRALLHAGARTTIKDASGKTPLGTDTTNAILNMMLSHNNVKRTRLHESANGVDPVTMEKVPRRDARVILGNNTSIRHVFHKNTIERLRRSRTGNVHPVTRQPFDPNNVVPLENALVKSEYHLYNRLKNNTNAGTLRKNNVVVISNSNSNAGGTSSRRRSKRTKRSVPRT
jgi:hypothetical protein